MRLFLSPPTPDFRGLIAALPHPDLVTFQAIAQKLVVDFLPITQQPDPQGIASGGTSQINLSVLHLQLSFVFKRFRSDHDAPRDNATIFKTLISEIFVLRPQSVRAHANITNFYRISWEV